VISVVPAGSILNLPNTTVLSAAGKETKFDNGLISIDSIQTFYQQPNIGNVYTNYSKLNYTATTYLNITSTSNAPLFLDKGYFRAINRNPKLSSIEIYQLVNETSVVNQTIAYTVQSNSTNSTNSSNQDTIPVVVNITQWEPIANNAIIIAPGINQFKITGLINPNKLYNWSYELSTANAINPSNALNLKRIKINYSKLKRKRINLLGRNLPEMVNQTQSIGIGNTTINQSSVGNYSLLQTISFGNESIDIDPNWLVPAGVSNIINVSLNNQQATAIATNVPIAIPFNGIGYNQYANGGLTNYEIFNGLTGNILYSWLEVGNSNTYSNGIIWISLPAQIAATTNAVNVISIGFASISTTLMNGNNTGESPILSQVYAQYDDGANVFNYYQNFKCASGGPCGVPAGWNAFTTNSGNSIINNGIQIITNGIIPNSIYLSSNIPITGNAVDVWASNAFYGSISGGLAQAQILSSSSSASKYVAVSNVVAYSNTLATNTVIETNALAGTFKILGNAISPGILGIKSPGPLGGNIIDVYANTVRAPANTIGVNVYLISATTFGGNFPFTTVANTPNSANVLDGQFFAFGANVAGTSTTDQNAIFTVNWIAVRIAPQKDIMPSPVFGSVGTTAQNTVTIMALSNTLIDQGQSILFTAAGNAGIGPYTYNYEIVNTLTSVVIANMLFTGVTTSTNTFFWTPPSVDCPGTINCGNTLEANVYITSTTTLSNSIYYFIGYNSVFTPTLTASNTPTVDTSQYEKFTASFTGGTGPYTYNYQVVNTITSTVIANELFVGNAYTSNTWLWLIPAIDAANTIKVNVIVTDSATTKVITASSYTSTITVNVLMSLPTLALSNTLIDQGQGILFTANTLANQGTPTYTYNYQVVNTITGTTIANMLFTGNSYTSNSWFWIPPSVDCPTTTNCGNTLKANVLITDSASTPNTVNSIFQKFGYNSILITPTISPMAINTLDQGQSISIAAYETGGTLAYTYNFLVFNAVSNVIVANMITTSNSFSFTSNSFWTSNSPLKANVLILDSATTNTFANSINSANIVANTALAIPTISTSNTLMDQNQYTVIAAYETGGTGPYTYNFLVFNAVSNVIVANRITTSNSFSFQSNSFWTSNSPLEANVFILDSATTNTFTNSINSGNIFTNSILTTPTLTISNTLTDSEQYITLTAAESGGTLPYIYNFYNVTTGSPILISACSLLSTNTCTMQVTSTTNSNTFSYNVVVADNAMVPISANSITESMTENIILGGVASSGGPTVPSGIVAYLPITVTNLQSNAIAINTPIAIGTVDSTQGSSNVIGFNALNYAQYYTCNLNNAEFFYSNGTIIESWLEGNTLNELTANSACTSSSSPDALIDSSNIIYWILPNSIGFLPANTGTATTNTIYLGWTGNVINSADNRLSNTITGEAPQLSCANPYSTLNCYYGEYDNGNVVFGSGGGFYDDFLGTSYAGPWTTIGATINPDNGLSIASTGSVYNTRTVFNSQQSAEESLTSESTEISAAAGMMQSANQNLPSSSEANVVLYSFYEPPTHALAVWAGTSGFNFIGGGTLGGTNPASVYSVFTDYFSSASVFLQVNYSTVGSFSGTFNSQQYMCLGVWQCAGNGGGFGSTQNTIWIRARNIPAVDGVLPETTYGSVYIPQTHSIPTLTASNTPTVKMLKTSMNCSLLTS
jgi:hypothetical protein